MKFLALIFLSIALILEASLTTIPFVFLVLLVFMVLSKGNWLFGFGFIFGILLDLVSFRTLGISSVFFVLYLFLIIIYQSKFEIETAFFVLVSAFLGSFIYLFITGVNESLIIQAVLSAGFGLGLFVVLKRLNTNAVS